MAVGSGRFPLSDHLGPRSWVMNETLNRLVPLLEADVVATLGEQWRHVVRGAVIGIYYPGEPDAVYEEKVVDNVQEDIIETGIDTTWPACPRHGRHPLVYHEGGWWCQQDSVVVCNLGELASQSIR